MRTDAFVFGELMADDMARQVSVQWLASTLEAFVSWHIHRAILASGAVFQRWRGLRGRGQGLCLVEEHVLLLSAACFALGGEELAQNLVKPLLQKVALGAHKAQF